LAYRLAITHFVPNEKQDLRHVFKGVALPLAFITGTYIVLVSLPFLDFSLEARQAITTLVQVVQVLSIGLVIYRVGNSLTVVYENHLKTQNTLGSINTVARVALLPPLRKAFLAVVFIATLLLLFRTLGFDVSALVAGLGVGGLAIALAGQKTFENLFGGISVVLDQPIRVGDFGRFGGIEGTVEDIGLRSTRIRTLDRTVITIPNAEFSQIKIENFAKRDRIRYRTLLGVRFDTTVPQLRTLLFRLRELLKADKRIDSEMRRVRLLNIGSSALEIEIILYVKTKDFEEYLSIREELNFSFLEIVESVGTECAYQTHAVYQGTLNPLPEGKQKAAEEFAKLNSL
jgi:MscS family membrane protein